jgi:hypothetical protein
MKSKVGYLMLMTAIAALCAPLAVAQDASTTATSTSKPKYTINERKQNQQKRIGEGVENGSLTANEAAHIEKQESRLNKEEQAMKSDGTLSAEERAKLQSQQNKLSKEIYNQKHDAQSQNLTPKSEVGERQRNQQERIGEGIENGSLNAREAKRLETREAGVNKEVAGMREANGGKLTKQERRLINQQQNRTSKAIYRQKHDAQHR